MGFFGEALCQGNAIARRVGKIRPGQGIRKRRDFRGKRQKREAVDRSGPQELRRGGSGEIKENLSDARPRETRRSRGKTRNRPGKCHRLFFCGFRRHSSRTCSDLAIPSVQIIAETGLTYTGLVSSFAGSGHTVLNSAAAQSLTPGDFLDARASADLVEPDQLASMNRRGNLGPSPRTLHVSCLALVGACELAPLCDRSDCPCHLGRSSAALPRSNPILRMRYVLLFRSCNITELNRNLGASPSLIRL